MYGTDLPFRCCRKVLTSGLFCPVWPASHARQGRYAADAGMFNTLVGEFHFSDLLEAHLKLDPPVQ